MNPDTFLARVHEHLDDRRDPLDDDDVVAFLDNHPEWLQPLAGLRGDARDVARVPAAVPIPRPVAQPRPRRWPWVVASCFAAAAAALVVAFLRTDRPAPPASRILAARFDEWRPRAHLAATFVVTAPLLTTPTTRFETWQTRSDPR